MPDETYRSIIQQLARTKSSELEIFIDFCRVAACICSEGTRKQDLIDVSKSYNQEEQKQLVIATKLLAQEMLDKPFTDILGNYYADIASHSSKQSRGEFYTPPALCSIMAKVIINPQQVISTGEPLAIDEPCCGSGGITLAAAKLLSPEVLGGKESYVNLLRFTCKDINPVAAHMCYINTSMWGIPAKIILGNALNPKEIKAEWKNHRWHYVEEDQRIEFHRMLDILRSSPQEAKPEPSNYDVTLPPMEGRLGAGDQFEFDMGI